MSGLTIFISYPGDSFPHEPILNGSPGLINVHWPTSVNPYPSINLIPNLSMNSSIISCGAGLPKTSLTLCSFSSGTTGAFHMKYDITPTKLNFVILKSFIHFQKLLAEYFSSTTTLAP